MTVRHILSTIIWRGVVPLAIYTACFFIMTWPMLLQWSSHFYNEGGDGMQNQWNLWWIDKAVTELHQSPWHTNYLHYPHGTTLVAHTLNPIHGFPAIVLRRILPPAQVYNLIIVASFALGGLTTFWLGMHVTRGAYWASLVSGFAFTFTGYHFAHLPLHMQLVAVEFVSLFLLLWLRLVEKPTPARSVAAAGGVALLALCDLYYLFYCAIAAAVILAWNFRSMGRSRAWALLVFGVLSLGVVAPIVVPILQVHSHDPLVGAHASADFCGDALAPFIPGGGSAWRELTQPYWSRLPVNAYESSVYLGMSTLGLAVFGLVKWRSMPQADGSAWLWAVIAGVFYALSLGPTLHVAGVARTGAVLPYHWLELLFPPLQLGGVPARMMVMAALGVAILAGIGLAELGKRGGPSRMAVAIALVGFMFVELWPRRFACVPDGYPKWVMALRDLPSGPVICKLSADNGMILYYQTGHEKPMALGLLARMTSSTDVQSQVVIRLVLQDRFSTLREQLGFRYIVCGRDIPQPALKPLYGDEQAVIYELQ